MRSWCLRLAGGVVVVLSLVLVGADLRFGSLAKARAYYRGELLTLSVPETQGITPKKDRFEFPLLITNNSPQPVLVLGFRAECRCAEVTGVPVRLSPLQNGLIEVTASAGTSQIILYTDTQPVIVQINVAPDKVTVTS